MSTLTDEDLTALLDGAASPYDVPPDGREKVLAARGSVPAAVPLPRRRWVQLSAASVAMVVAVVAMGAVSGGGGSDNADMTAAGGVTKYADNSGGADTARPPAAQSGGVAGGGTGGSVGGLAPAAPVAPAPQPVKQLSGSAPEKPSTGAVAAPAPDGADSRVVKTGTIALVAKDKQVSSTLDAVQRAAKANGGYIASSTSNEYGDTPSGQVTIRVPVARFEDLVAAVRRLNAEVRTATTSGKDVSAEYNDIESQLRTLRATRERFLVILSQTKTISEILTVQQRVDNVSGQIDRLEGSRKLLASQSDLSTLTVSVSESGDPVVRVQEDEDGFGQALRDAKDGFLGGIEAIVRHSGTALLWVLVLAVALVVGRGAWKVARRRLV